MMAAGIQAGSRRRFTAEQWPFLKTSLFAEVKAEALAGEHQDVPDECFIAGSDLSARSIAQARKNARRAGVEQWIDFSVCDVKMLQISSLLAKYQQERVLFVTNPPYGVRISDSETVRALHQVLADLIFYPRSKFTKPGVRASIFTAANFEEHTGQKADKRRKLYNGMLRCTMYHYFREKYLD